MGVLGDTISTRVATFGRRCRMCSGSMAGEPDWAQWCRRCKLGDFADVVQPIEARICTDADEETRLQVEEIHEDIDAQEWRALLGALDLRDWP